MCCLARDVGKTIRWADSEEDPLHAAILLVAEEFGELL
jgi:hypothetical protein